MMYCYDCPGNTMLIGCVTYGLGANLYSFVNKLALNLKLTPRPAQELENLKTTHKRVQHISSISACDSVPYVLPSLTYCETRKTKPKRNPTTEKIMYLLLSIIVIINI